jgi:hypothetical protein
MPKKEGKSSKKKESDKSETAEHERTKAIIRPSFLHPKLEARLQSPSRLP